MNGLIDAKYEASAPSTVVFASPGPLAHGSLGAPPQVPLSWPTTWADALRIAEPLLPPSMAPVMSRLKIQEPRGQPPQVPTTVSTSCCE